MLTVINVRGLEIRIEGRLLRTARPEQERYQTVADPEGLLDELRTCGHRIDLFTFMQGLPETDAKYSYPMEWDNWAVLSVTSFDHWWNKQIDNKTRNIVRKAERKGVVLREVPFDEALVRGIWRIYNETPVRQGRPFPHYGKDLDTVTKAEGTYLDRSVFLGAFLNDELIGFARLLYNEARTTAHLISIVSMILHRDKAPTNALVAQAVRSCAERGFSYLVYAKFAYGKKELSSLSDFKSNNGFERVNLPRYYIPLTRLGWTTFRLGFHHRLLDLFPEPFLAKVRELRGTWYSRRLRDAKGTS